MDICGDIIDKCSSHTAPYDIAIIVHKLYKGCFRYKGQYIWEYYDQVENIWKRDQKSKRLHNEIKSYVSDLFVQRYMYLSERDDASEYINLKVILNMGCKLKTNNFISLVIKEARSFFDAYDD
jgi:hypothetical protein